MCSKELQEIPAIPFLFAKRKEKESIPSEQISRVHLFLYFVENAIVAVDHARKMFLTDFVFP